MKASSEETTLKANPALVKRLWLWTGLVLLVLGLGTVRSVVARMDNDKVLVAQAQSGQAQYVKVTQAKSGGAAWQLHKPMCSVCSSLKDSNASWRRFPASSHGASWMWAT